MNKKAIVTGCAGFIGSHLTDSLLASGWEVIGVDNLSTGLRRNVPSLRPDFEFFEMDVGTMAATGRLLYEMQNADVVYHLAALGSVPRSIEEPVAAHSSNVNAFVGLLESARLLKTRPRIVFASSSSVYGDCPRIMKRESDSGTALSPYAATKQAMEIYARVFAQTYGLNIVGLRYFNVFGPRQRPDSAYAAVIPAWSAAMLRGAPVMINGQGQHKRDFTPVADVVRATRAAGTCLMDAGVCRIFNVGCGRLVSLQELFVALSEITGYKRDPFIGFPRPGDVFESGADTTLLEHALGFKPDGSQETFKMRLKEVIDWMRGYEPAPIAKVAGDIH